MSRLSLYFSRIFRFRGRRAGKDNANSTRAFGRIASEPGAPLKSHCTGSSHLEPLNTALAPSTRPRSFFTPPALSPIAQSPFTTSPAATPIVDKSTPILIIGHNPPSSPLPSPPAPALSGDVEPQADIDKASFMESPSERRVSFQLPPAQTQDRPGTPVSTCSTLVPGLGAHAEEAVTGPAVRPTQPPLQAAGVASVHTASAEAHVQADSGSRRTRPASLFVPQPVRLNLSRFSLPAARTAPTAPITAVTTDNGRDHRRASQVPPAPKKEKRMSRLSRELDKPETQEVLKMLAMTRFG